MIAVARLFLDNIANIQASWVKYGPKLAQLMLTAGANDLGGTLFNENISRAAGKETEEYLAPEVIISLISDMGYSPQQRTTLYNLF
jgi:FO synthase subunit 2